MRKQSISFSQVKRFEKYQDQAGFYPPPSCVRPWFQLAKHTNILKK